MRRMFGWLVVMAALSSGCCIRLDVPFVPFIADPSLAPPAAPAASAADITATAPGRAAP